MSIKLYEIPLEMQSIYLELEENCGEMTPELEERMLALVSTSKDKLENCAYLMRNLELQAGLAKAQAGVFQAEAARCAAVSASFEAAADRLGELMAPALDVTGKIKTLAGTLYTQQRTTWAFELKAGTPFGMLDEKLWRQAEPELNKKPLAKLAESHPITPEFVTILTAAKALPPKDLAQVAADAVITDTQLNKAVEKLPEEAMAAVAAVRALRQLPDEILGMPTTRTITILKAPSAKGSAEEPTEAPETAA